MNIVDSIVTQKLGFLQSYLSSGGDPNFSEDSAGVTLLHHAVSCRDCVAIAILLQYGADPLSCDRFSLLSPYEMSLLFGFTQGALLMVGAVVGRQH